MFVSMESIEWKANRRGVGLAWKAMRAVTRVRIETSAFRTQPSANLILPLAGSGGAASLPPTHRETP
jgi:hypothetical protein